MRVSEPRSIALTAAVLAAVFVGLGFAADAPPSWDLPVADVQKALAKAGGADVFREECKAARAGGQPVQSAAMITLGFLTGALAWGSGILGTNDPSLPALIPTLLAVGIAVANEIRSSHPST